MAYNFLAKPTTSSAGLGAVCENVLPYRSYFIPCSSKKLCDKTDVFSLHEYSDRVQLLQEWDFLYFPSGIVKEDFDFGSSHRVTVPHSFASDGKEEFTFYNDAYPFKAKPFKVPSGKKSGNSAGLYRYFLDYSSVSERQILSFTRVGGTFEVYVNERYIGKSAVSRAEFDITSFLNEGRNEIVVYVKKWSPFSYLDTHGFCVTGLSGAVFLYSMKKNSVWDYFLSTRTEEGSHIGDLKITMQDGAKGEVEVTVLDGKEKLFQRRAVIEGTTVKIKITGEFDIYATYKNKLYDMYIKTARDGLVDECIKVKIGFGALDVTTGVALYNGRPIKLGSVNYYAPYNKNGRLLTFAEIKRDIDLIREFNFNTVCLTGAVEPFVMQYILEAGLMVIQSFEIDTRACVSFGKKKRDMIADNDLFASAAFLRTTSLFERDKSLTNVILWSFNEEKARGVGFIGALNYVTEKARVPILYRNPQNVYQDNSVSTLYNPNVDELLDAVNDPKKKKPVFMSKYASASGGGAGAFYEFFDLIMHTPAIFGGSVTEFCDQTIGNTCYTDYGCFNGARKAYPSAENYKHNYRTVQSRRTEDGKIEIYNRSRFSQANVTVRVQVQKNGEIVNDMNFDPLILAEEAWSFELPTTILAGDMFVNLTYTDKTTGAIVAREQLTLNNAMLGVHPQEGKGATSVNDVGKFLEVKFDGGVVTFNKDAGTITGYRVLGKEILKPMPSRKGGGAFAPNIYRPFIRNLESGDAGAYRYTVKSFSWKNASSVNGSRITVVESTTAVAVKKKDTFLITDTFTITADGAVRLKSVITPHAKKCPNLDCFGRQLRLHNTFSNIKYYGRGESDNYIDMWRHTQMGVHTQTVDRFGRVFAHKQECENKIDVHYTAITDSFGDGIMLTAVNVPYQLRVSPFSDEEIYKAYVKDTIPEQSGVYVDVNAVVCGIGSSFNGMPQKQYLVKPTEHTLQFEMLPIISKK